MTETQNEIEHELIKQDLFHIKTTLDELKNDFKILSKLVFLINGGAIVIGFLLK